jgi:hypothetical protein
MQGEGAREDDAALKEGKPSAEEKVWPLTTSNMKFLVYLN